MKTLFLIALSLVLSSCATFRDAPEPIAEETEHVHRPCETMNDEMLPNCLLVEQLSKKHGIRQ